MVNSCLKKLKFHLASFDKVVKERTTATAITEGMWGFKHTKACFRDYIIPFVKALKELFTSFDQCLIDEVTEVQNVFKQMELAAISVDIVNLVLISNVNVDCLNMDACLHCVNIESELKKDFIRKDCYGTLLQKYNTLKKHFISVEVDNQHKTEIYQRNTLFSPDSAPTFKDFFKINDLKAHVQAKDTVILKLKETLHSLNGDVNERNVKREVEEMETLNIELDHKVTKFIAENEHLKQTYKQLYDSIKSSPLKEQLNKLKGKTVITEAVYLNHIGPELLKVDVAPLALKLRKNRTTRTDYIRHTKEEAATLREIVERVILVSSGSGSMSQDNTKKNRIWQTQRKAKKNKLEDYLRTVSSSLNKKNVVAISFVGNNVSNVNSDLKFASLPPKESSPIVHSTDKPVVTLVYSRKPKAANKKVHSLVANKMEPNSSWGSSSYNVSSPLIDCRLSKSSSGT
nr:retrovirus-related Pol polyprotein from transposon TNT 1-94 [Tanacetum cinerariifolium]